MSIQEIATTAIDTLSISDIEALIDLLSTHVSDNTPREPVDDSWDSTICWDCGHVLLSNGDCPKCNRLCWRCGTSLDDNDHCPICDKDN